MPNARSNHVPGPTRLCQRRLCFAGTKVRVETLFNYLCDGGTVDVFLDEFEGTVGREQAMCAIETAAREFVQRHEGSQVR